VIVVGARRTLFHADLPDSEGQKLDDLVSGQAM
jgi:hypothetical protein